MSDMSITSITSDMSTPSVIRDMSTPSTASPMSVMPPSRPVTWQEQTLSNTERVWPEFRKKPRARQPPMTPDMTGHRMDMLSPVHQSTTPRYSPPDTARSPSFEYQPTSPQYNFSEPARLTREATWDHQNNSPFGGYMPARSLVTNSPSGVFRDEFRKLFAKRHAIEKTRKRVRIMKTKADRMEEASLTRIRMAIMTLDGEAAALTAEEKATRARIERLDYIQMEMEMGTGMRMETGTGMEMDIETGDDEKGTKEDERRTGDEDSRLIGELLDWYALESRKE